MVRLNFSEWLYHLITLIILILDQISKLLVFHYQPEWDLKILNLHLITNSGAGFGLLQNQSLLLGLFSLIVVLIIGFNYRKIAVDNYSKLFVAILLGGILGNLFDRLFRGVVIDFLDFSFWPAFNLADAAITISILALIIYYWKTEKNKN